MGKKDGDISNALGRLMSAYRAATGISQRQLGESTGISLRRIQQLERDEEDKGDVTFGLIQSFARVQQKPVPEFVAELLQEAEAGSNYATATPSFEHLVRKHVRREFAEILHRHAAIEKDKYGNELAWALEIAVILLSLSDPDRLEIEMAIRRKSPDRSKPENLARIREIFNYTLEE